MPETDGVLDMTENQQTGSGDTSCTLHVFGGVAVDCGGEPVSIGGPRQRRLAALLAIRHGRAVDIDWLTEYLWSDDDRPEDPEVAIRTYVSRLRRALPEEAADWVQTVPGGYRLDATADAVEHVRFGSLRAAATQARRNGDAGTAHDALDEALRLWRGDPFPELEDLDWAAAEVERLRQDRLEMIEERFETALALGRHTQITGDLAAFTAEHELRERAWRQYALALHRSGRTSEALGALHRYRAALRDRSGLDPSPALAELEAKLLDGDAELAAPPQGRPLRGYRLLEQIGSGAFSIVWRAEQPSVQREVAIKQIRAELAGQPDFIRRFEAEAKLVARIEHPHIVPLIDYWRDPDSAYLVMRWLRGGTLEEMLDSGPLPVDRVLEIARQVGDALAAAHAHGVVHRDVKAANIMFDDRDNAFLGDFGIALDAIDTGGPEAALSHGSPAYASPEQLRREPLGPEADIFSLAVVLYECLVGSLPFPDVSSHAEMVQRQLHDPYPEVTDLRPDVPASVAAAIDKATAKQPVDRFRTIDEFLAALTGQEPVAPARAGSGRRTTVAGDLANPYKGLQSFDESDADSFFGRDRLVAELVQQLGGGDLASRCLTVVGPSGSGKSSLVRAGLLPALRAGRPEGADTWFVTTMMPGGEPFEALEAALLRIAVNPPSSLLDQLGDGPRGILRSVRRCLAGDDDRVLVVIDQFEELFTSAAPDVADAFLNALAVAVEDPKTPLRVVATLRADFYDRPLAHPSFARVLKAGAVDVTPLAADELEQAIVEPADRVGVTFAPGLVARVAAEAVGQAAPLPMLQYTLAEMFDQRVADTMTGEVYDRLGGLSGAVAARAEELYLRGDGAERAATRRIFGRLTSAGEDRADLRRRALVADLGDDAATVSVLERYGSARLLTFDRDATSREPTVEVAHEALLREWPRLVEWLDEDRDVLRVVELLAAASSTWDNGGRVDSDLYRGGRLEAALDLAVNSPDRLRPVDREFVDASRSAAEAEQLAERRRVRRLRRLVVGTAAALVVAVIAGALAFRQQRRADDEADRAQAAAAEAEMQAQLADEQAAAADEARTAAEAAADDADLATLVSRSAALAADEPAVSVLLAVEAHNRAPGPDTAGAVLDSLTRLGNRVAVFAPLTPRIPAPCENDGTLRSDGLAQYASLDGRMVRQNLVSGELVDLGALPGCAWWTADTAETMQLAVAFDGTRYWRGEFGGDWSEPLPLPAGVGAGGPSPTLDRLPLYSGNPRAGASISLLDTSTGMVVGQPVTDLVKPHASFSADGAFLAIASGTVAAPDGAGPIIMVDAMTGEELFRTDISSRGSAFLFDLDSQELLVGTASGRMITLDLATGEVADEVETGVNQDIVWLGTGSGGLIVSGSRGLVELVDPQRGPIPGSRLELRQAAAMIVRPDGTVLVHDEDHENVVLDLDGSALVEQSIAAGALNRGEFGFGKAVMLDIGTGVADVIDLATGEREPVELVEPDGSPFVALALVPRADGFLGFASDLRVARFRNGVMDDLLEAATEPGVIIAAGDGYPGRVALVGERRGGGHEVHLISTEDAAMAVLLTIELDAAGPFVAYPTFDGDGLHVLFPGGALRTYDSTGAIVAELEIGLRRAEWAAGDGERRLALAGFDGTVIVDLESRDVTQLPGIGSVGSVAFIRGGEFLIIGGRDGVVRLWDIERGDFAGVLWDGEGTGLGNPWYDAETDSVWVTTSGSAVRVPLTPERWIERACEVVGRNLTEAEWAEYVPGDEPWRPTCVGFES